MYTKKLLLLLLLITLINNQAHSMMRRVAPRLSAAAIPFAHTYASITQEHTLTEQSTGNGTFNNNRPSRKRFFAECMVFEIGAYMTWSLLPDNEEKRRIHSFQQQFGPSKAQELLNQGKFLFFIGYCEELQINPNRFNMPDGSSVLMHACKLNNPALIKHLLLKSGVNVKPENKHHPLLHALKTKNYDMFFLLINNCPWTQAWFVNQEFCQQVEQLSPEAVSALTQGMLEGKIRALEY